MNGDPLPMRDPWRDPEPSGEVDPLKPEGGVPPGSEPSVEETHRDEPEMVDKLEALNRLAYGSATVEDIAYLRTALKNGEISISDDERSLVISITQKEEVHYHFEKNLDCTYVTTAANQMYGLLNQEDRGQNYLRATKIGRIALTRLLDDPAFLENLVRFNQMDSGNLSCRASTAVARSPKRSGKIIEWTRPLSWSTSLSTGSIHHSSRVASGL